MLTKFKHGQFSVIYPTSHLCIVLGCLIFLIFLPLIYLLGRYDVEMSTEQQNLQDNSTYDPSEESLFTTRSDNFGIYCERGKAARLNFLFYEIL